MLSTIRENDLQAGAPSLNRSDVEVSQLLPAGMVTLLLADVEDSAPLWDTQPTEMTAADGRLQRAMSEAIREHNGVQPTEQGDGGSFVVAFARASDAVACALQLQCAALAPVRLRIGLHTSEVQLRNDTNYTGPEITRTARLRDLAHGGQTVLSRVTEEMLVDRLPDGAWLTDLGIHRLQGLPRRERVAQLCHPNLRNEFPALHASNDGAAHGLPVQLTTFIGRNAEMADVCQLLADHRLVTLVGAGGVGKTRLAVQIAAELSADYGNVWYLDLAPISQPDLVPATLARTLGLPNQPGGSPTDSALRFLADLPAVLVLDNCEHLLDATAELVTAVIDACPRVRLVATSREPIGVAGEVSWRVPSLSLTNEAVELFSDRARRVRPDFRGTDETAVAILEICRRLDGLPLAIELAAARMRALSPAEILDGLHDRFRLLTGGARTAVRRQQTLLASVDWSHALLTQPERILFRRLAVFVGGFDLDAAQSVCGSSDVQRYQVLDELTLLVDKSLVVADDTSGRTRYRLLETVRQFAAEKLSESGEADTVRTCHRDHYTAMAAQLDTSASAVDEQRLERAETEIDNLRAAFRWSHDNKNTELALALASSLQPLWLTRGHLQEGLAWLDAAVAATSPDQLNLSPARVRAIADKALLVAWNGFPVGIEEAQQALSIARELNDPGLLARALMAVGTLTAFADPAGADPYFKEAADISREIGDRWRLSQILLRQAVAAIYTGDIIAGDTAAGEAFQLADAIGDRFNSRQCRWVIGWAQTYRGDLTGAVTRLRGVTDDATAANDGLMRVIGLLTTGLALAYQGDSVGAQATADAVLKESSGLAEFYEGYGHVVLAVAALAAGEPAAAWRACKAARRLTGLVAATGVIYMWAARAPLACGDLDAASEWADTVVSLTKGCDLSAALATRARVAMARGELEQAEGDAHDALTVAARLRAHLIVPDILECLGDLAVSADSHREAARLFGAADAARRRMGAARFKIHQTDYDASIATLRMALGDTEFDAIWAEGAALSIDDAMGYARRGRGGRKRPTTGWWSLTPAELDVVRLVSEGLATKDIAARLFVSPRTVQTHLTHIYSKLDLTSRVQLAQEAARHA
jgi:predicted ATPase/class 3 adenylate cyclase/DNA-binding CsgD family transcriptional regulator